MSNNGATQAYRIVNELPSSAFRPEYQRNGAGIRIFPVNGDIPALHIDGADEVEMFLPGLLQVDEPLIPLSIMIACCRSEFFDGQNIVSTFPKLTYRALSYVESMLEDRLSGPGFTYEHPQAVIFERALEGTGWVIDSDMFIYNFMQEAKQYSTVDMLQLRNAYLRHRKLLGAHVPGPIAFITAYSSLSNGASFNSGVRTAFSQTKVSKEYFRWLLQALSFLAGAAPLSQEAATSLDYGATHENDYISLPMAGLPNVWPTEQP